MKRQLSLSVSAFLVFNLGLVALFGCLANFGIAVAAVGDEDDYSDDYYAGDDGDEVYFPEDDEYDMRRADTVVISGCKAAGDEGSGGDDECEQIKENDFPCQITACKDAVKQKFCSFNYLDDEGVCPDPAVDLKNPPAPKGCNVTKSGKCFERCKEYSKKTVSVLGQKYKFVAGVGKSYRCPIGRKTVCGCTSVAKKA